jgi:endonuclease-3
LQKLFPESDWSILSTALIWHGRRVCFARNPNCDQCLLRPDCPYPKRP